MSRRRFPAFQEAFRNVAAEAMGPAEPVRELRADLPVALNEMSLDVLKYLHYIGPFGQGNPEPVFLARGVRIAGCSVHKGRQPGPGHLRFRMEDGGAGINGIAFRMADLLAPRARPLSRSGEPADVAFNVIANDYGGFTTVQAKGVDLRAASPVSVEGPAAVAASAPPAVG